MYRAVKSFIKDLENHQRIYRTYWWKCSDLKNMHASSDTDPLTTTSSPNYYIFRIKQNKIHISSILLFEAAWLIYRSWCKLLSLCKIKSCLITDFAGHCSIGTGWFACNFSLSCFDRSQLLKMHEWIFRKTIKKYCRRSI